MAEIETRRSRTEPASSANAAPAGHNRGPPLDDEHKPEWGDGGIGNYFYWKAAHRAAWKNPSPGIVAFRIRKAERLGLTYEEYTLEILERGRHLQIEDVERIAASSSGAPPARPPIETTQQTISSARSQHSCRISRSEHCNPRPIPARCSVNC
jgi:hypothetical protein